MSAVPSTPDDAGSDRISNLEKNNVQVFGSGPQCLIFAHGFGCDQNAWQLMTPAFERDYRIVLFDHVGVGGSDVSRYDPVRYSTLEAYAEDVVGICDELALHAPVFIGHSVSAMIGVMALKLRPRLFSKMVMMAPSPRYLDDEGYRGGFSREDIHGLLDLLERNHLGWSSAMAPVIMSNPGRPMLAAELEASFCRMAPAIARQFAHVTFLSDSREHLDCVTIPTLIMQCTDDAIAPVEVGQYLHRQIPDSHLVQLRATGHCPHMSAPRESVAVIKAFL